MGLLLRCVLLLSVSTFIVALRQHTGTQSGAQMSFVLRSGSGARIAKRSLKSWLPSALSPGYRRVRRSASVGQGDSSCKALQGYETKLAANTHSYSFNDLSGSVSLAWIGDGTGVILALTFYQVPLFFVRYGQSKLYRSEDYGKSFKDISNLINNTFIRPELGIAIDPTNSGKVLLTCERSGEELSRIFISDDFGKTFTYKDLPFEPANQIKYDPDNSKVLLAVSIENELWLSEEFGNNWKKIHSMVCMAKWGGGNTVYFTASTNGSCFDKGMLELKKTTDYGKTIQIIGTKIYSFGIGGRFLFASVMTGEGMLRKIQVSVDKGENWNIAQLPPVGHEQFYSILSANDEMVFMHVDEKKDSSDDKKEAPELRVGTIYTSDDRGIVYSKSLENHLYSPVESTDFTNVTSLRGVFITSVLINGVVVSVITFDQGGEWLPLRKPADANCPPVSTPNPACNFYIHAAYSTAIGANMPMMPTSEPNAVGLILAHGSVGSSMSALNPDVYVSDDGGYSWMKALKGPHHYAILDSGGLLVAVENDPNRLIDKIKFSTDEGQCWSVYNFSKDPMYFSGLASEPGARSMNVSLWGYREQGFSYTWVSVTIDFRDLLTRVCEDEDYVPWLAHSDDISDPTDGCMLGYKENFRRLKKDSVCVNGRDYVVNPEPTPCLCTLDDFQCDFGYYRKENSSLCVEQPDLMGKILEFCLHGNEEQLVTSGYRKIPGDKCEGGEMPQRKEIDLRTKCVSDLFGPELLVEKHSSRSAAIVVTVGIVMLLSVAAGVLFVKKYICGGRFLVHRYSVLQRHMEDHTVEEMDDPLESNHVQNGKIEFHDDSDEDLLE